MGRSEITRESLFQAALKLFARDGFEKTTMRAIAAKAEVAPGASYYYYSSKESLIQEFYNRLHQDHINALDDFLKTEKNFEKRLHRTVTSKMELAEPYKDMSRALYRVAANPESEMSPFSKTSQTLRLESLAIFEDVVKNSDARFHEDFVGMLPKYLWFYQMGIILYWIYDSSKNSKKTYDLIDKTVPLIVWMNEMLRSPLAAPFRKKIFSVLKSFEPHME